MKGKYLLTQEIHIYQHNPLVNALNSFLDINNGSNIQIKIQLIRTYITLNINKNRILDVMVNKLGYRYLPCGRLN